MPDLLGAVTMQIKLLSCEIIERDGIQYVAAQFDDLPEQIINVTNYEQYYRDPSRWTQAMKDLLILDWLQEGVSGKTAVMDCSTPDDVWIRGVSNA